jgi:hypothetical protein
MAEGGLVAACSDNHSHTLETCEKKWQIHQLSRRDKHNTTITSGRKQLNDKERRGERDRDRETESEREKVRETKKKTEWR